MRHIVEHLESVVIWIVNFNNQSKSKILVRIREYRLKNTSVDLENNEEIVYYREHRWYYFSPSIHLLMVVELLQQWADFKSKIFIN